MLTFHCIVEEVFTALVVPIVDHKDCFETADEQLEIVFRYDVCHLPEKITTMLHDDIVPLIGASVLRTTIFVALRNRYAAILQ